MASSRSLYDDERTLPYWVRLAKVAEENDAVVSKARPMLMFLDFRGGEFTRASADRLADTFEWITKAHRLRVDDLSNYCLTITPIRRDQAEQAIGTEYIPYIPDDWPTVKDYSFDWVPVAHGFQNRRYAWQK
jgi:hypothetical protein